MARGRFIRCYLDEDVDVLVAELLKARGFQVITTRDAGRLGANDFDQFSYAVAHGCTLVTHNRSDFKELADDFALSEIHHHGLILATRHPPYELVRRLLRVLNHVTADEMQGCIRYI